MAADESTQRSSQAGAARLATPVQFLKGVGPARAELFARLGLHTVRDVLFYFPRDYEDLSDLRTIDALQEGQLVSVRGRVEELDQRQTTSGGSLTGILVSQPEGHLRAVWFNQPFIRDKFQVGQTVVLSGRPKLHGLFWEMAHPRVQILEEDDSAELPLLPIYGLTEGLSQGNVRSAVRHCLENYLAELDEVFPQEYLDAHGLWPLRRALPQVHFPDDAESLEQAHGRFVYQELLVLQLALALRREAQRTVEATPLDASARIDARIRRRIPFELTPGQNEVIAEIAADMGRSQPMNRLLQGDVGSGKTVAAVYAMLLAVAHGRQAALMAPTEVLARQHLDTLGRLLAKSDVRVEPLLGGLTSKQRQEALACIAAGDADIVMGTQAILSADVEFKDLALVVVDEGHKFGVRQRARLKSSGLSPHYLVMTATPIPRTTTMALYGDLDVSTLRDCPPGRQQVNTYLATEEQRGKWWDFVRRKLREGRQGYVVTPRVQADESTASVEERFEALANGELEAFRLGLIHGRLTPAEKDEQMAAFRRGELQVLVCTTVVEVGVDVPEATLMTIENGESFGLSQLHQLRGRVSRGTHPGFCTVFADPKNEEARERLEAFVNNSDGFELAELDFQLRGPGDIFGTRQHGLPPLRVADLVRDADVLARARDDAAALVAADPGLASEQHERLRRMVLARYGKVLELGAVG